MKIPINFQYSRIPVPLSICTLIYKQQFHNTICGITDPTIFVESSYYDTLHMLISVLSKMNCSLKFEFKILNILSSAK